MSIKITVAAATRDEPNLAWDTTWNGFVGDFGPAAPTEASNVGGFRARAQLATAVLLCLMSDGQAAASDFIPDGSGDRRGWAGDVIDPTIAPLGSRLWLLRRAALTDATGPLAEAYAREALQTLIDQKACASVVAQATVAMAEGRLDLAVALFAADGSRAIAMNFQILWDKASAVPHPLD